jgi:hypothetical protein
VQTNVVDADDHFGDDDGEKPLINLTAFLNDFGNQDFLDKNVRVRPVSGQTRGGDLDETKTNNNMDGGKSLMMGGVDPTDDEEKFNKMINLDMEEQRKNIKLKREEFIRRKQIEEEKSKKKKVRD